MTYVILDLEFNSAFSKRKQRFVNEIIEFGAVKCDENLNIVDTFSSLVTPQIQKRLNSHVKKLTHITIEELERAHLTFTQVFSKFRKFVGDGAVLTWGTGDILALMDNCRYYYGKAEIPFSSYLNLQTFCETALGHPDRSKQMGLSACAEKIGVGYDAAALHRALEDARLSFLCFQKLFDERLFLSLKEDVDEEFYRKITFKNYSISDLKDPRVDKKEMFFLCENCGKKAKRKSRWNLKNRSFRARFRCSRCKSEFEGRITFRATYDGVRVVKRTAPAEDKKREKAARTQENAKKT